ncbi:MAG: glycosyltransferase family 2 protein [Yoonia sp.]|uniref:glycosyltransferase family 2 protein n=1 Tax=Yoonia sp. TaxID=2212373 RepID=UPI00273E1029|nr:glycosyltransferase family 2 protein [Yoonia sp.]MDP5086099.1 glycosyltransferase family 2 protein [Yoonia sp.]
MSNPTVLTIVLNYKTAQMTIDAAASALVAMADLPGEIVIVDNDSQDGSFEAMSAHVQTEGWDRTRVIQSASNGGYGAGNNVGIRAGLSDGSRPDFIYILNSDAFPQPDAIKVLYDHMLANPTTGFAGSFIHGDDGAPHTTTFRFPSIFSEIEGAIRFGPVSRVLRNYRVPVDDIETTRPVDWLAGASLMMRQDLLDRIGLFDETFFLYFEETDLCRRARKAGFEIIYVKESVVMHLGSVSTGMKTWAKTPTYWYDSRFYYFAKNHGKSYAAAATLLHLTCGSLNWLRCTLTGKPSGLSPAFLRRMAGHDLKALFASRASQIGD